MSITVSAEYAQANLLRLLNDLDAGTHDKVIVMDGSETEAEELCQVVTWVVYEAADPADSGGVVMDIEKAYAISPSVQGKSLYRLMKRMRDRQAAPDALIASGLITCVAKAAMVDGETVVMTNAAGVGYTFHINQTGVYTPGGGYDATNLEVDISADVTADDVATTLAGVIDGTGGFIAPAPAANIIAVSQSDPGDAGNYGITETVTDGSFTVSGFAGGSDANPAGGVIGLKVSKNDATPRSAIVPADHAAVIGL